MKKIVPAILTNDKEDLKNKLKQVEGLSDLVQIDIMDGQFVPNTSINLAVLKKIKTSSDLEIHLMVFNPERYFEDCQKLRAKRAIFHLEATKNPLKILKKMRKYSFEKGIALNPETPIEKVKPYLRYLDLVLLLGVTPGFQGQKFQKVVLEKIKKLKKISKKIKIGVDGGVNLSNIREIAKTEAENLVVGSYLFQSRDIELAFKRLKRKLERS